MLASQFLAESMFFSALAMALALLIVELSIVPFNQLNEAAVKSFGWGDPIGKTISYSDQGEYKVFGVMKDFNFIALYSPIMSFGLFHRSSNTYDIPDSYIVVRVPDTHVDQTIKFLNSEWKAFAPTMPFEYEFAAWPAAWYGINKWLQNFAYRIDLTIWPFLLAGLTALVIALLTVSWRATRAAMVNAVRSLRYE